MGQQIQFALSQSAHRVLLKVASFLPGIVALMLAVILLTLIGAAVSAILRRVLSALKFDERIAQNQNPALASGIQGWSSTNSPTVLVARVAFWVCVLLGFVIGIAAFDASYSSSAQVSIYLLPYLSHATGAAILLLAGNLIARFLARSVLIGAVNAKLTYARFLSLGVKWLVLVLTGAMVLDHLEIGGTIIELAFGIFFGGIILTLSLAVGLGSRDLVSRSLEKTPAVPAVEPAPLIPTAQRVGDNLRHF